MPTKSRKRLPDSPEPRQTSPTASQTAESTNPPDSNPNDRPAINTFGGLITRLTWFCLGPAAILLTLCGILSTGSGWATALDAIYFVFVGVVIWCRWTEQRSGRGATVYGEPTTWDDFRRYVKTLLLVAFGAWVLANLLGNHVLQDGLGL
ncbi:MAG: hypothetical protein PHO07_05720 [Pirellulales bacterium]|jgi:hypothetical protein|nr:hypothetical protein [Thermoguttaceae bacterium]MDD4786655.1 hypothetical protein [Pirellulales bacterium]MDI9446759.1 hypothetical protein [Planctomycetota bacterium]NLY99414.1 hypothetical protein [Pirellulaceae bacterium]